MLTVFSLTHNAKSSKFGQQEWVSLTWPHFFSVLVLCLLSGNNKMFPDQIQFFCLFQDMDSVPLPEVAEDSME